MKKWHIQLKAALISLLLMLIFFLNPFGLRTAAEKYNEDLIIGFNAPMYPTTAQQQIAVILLDDAFVRHYAERYPVDYSSLNQLLLRISQFQPKAVFFDILQYYKTSEHLNFWTRRLAKSQQKFPVFMASIPQVDSSDYFANQSTLRKNLRASSQFTAVGWEGYQHYYPLKLTIGGEQYQSAAMDLYQAWCLSEAQRCPYQETEFSNGDLFDDVMIVQWGSNPAENQQDYVYLEAGQHCQDSATSRWRLLLEGISSRFHSGLSGGEVEKSSSYPCPQVLTVSATKLFQEDNKQALEVLKDRVILVGYGLESSADLVVSPVNGALPGVFFHAVALDNLINFGDNYWHVPNTIEFLGINISDLIEGLLQAVLLYATFYYRYTLIEQTDNRRQRDKPWFTELLIVFLAVLITFACVVVAYKYLKYGPVNWYAFIIILLAIFPTFAHHLLAIIFQKLGQKFSKYLHDTKALMKGLVRSFSYGVAASNRVKRLYILFKTYWKIIAQWTLLLLLSVVLINYFGFYLLVFILGSTLLIAMHLLVSSFRKKIN